MTVLWPVTTAAQSRECAMCSAQVPLPPPASAVYRWLRGGNGRGDERNRRHFTRTSRGRQERTDADDHREDEDEDEEEERARRGREQRDAHKRASATRLGRQHRGVALWRHSDIGDATADSPADSDSSDATVATPPPLAVELIRYGRREYRVNAHTGELEVAEVHRRRTWRGRACDRIRRYFLPDGFPDSVGPDYGEYTKWRGCAFFFGGAVGVFSTQSLLLAVGVGRSSAAPLAAALQWVIRDGVGRAGRMLFSQVGTGFDAETKQYRLAAAFVLNLSCALEALTPAFPALFLPLACAANMAKGASTVAAASTRGAIYRSFMRRENLGDITAKQETVGVAGDLLGTASGIALSRLTAHSRRLAAAAFLAVSAAHLFSVYREVKGVRLQTLNRQRAHVLVTCYLESGGVVPSVRAVNLRERIVDRPWRDALHAPNMELGARLAEAAPDAAALQYLLRVYRHERYMLAYERGRVRVVLRHDASSRDMIKAFLQSRDFWRRYQQAGGARGGNGEDADDDTAAAHRRALLEASYRAVHAQFDVFMRRCRDAGWKADHFVLLRPVPRRVNWR